MAGMVQETGLPYDMCMMVQDSAGAVDLGEEGEWLHNISAIV